MKSYTAVELKEILHLHAEWLRNEKDGKCAKFRNANFCNADLQSVNLQCAYLRGANFYCADLERANLKRADLRNVNFPNANLRNANLRNADLRDVNFRGANLESASFLGASLEGADFRNANLRGATLQYGDRWEDYLANVVPALLTAGGKTVKQIVARGAWECHSWDNCPMAEAFSVNREWECPALLRPRVSEFIQLFDAGLIPCPVV